jgi:mxaA protein
MRNQISNNPLAKAMQRLLWVAVMVLTTNAAMAATAEKHTTPTIRVFNPATNNHVHIGDVLRRTVVLQVPAAYQFSDQALPKKGSKHDGIELVNVAVQSEAESDHTQYTLQLSYQVFAASMTPTVMQLPTEKLVFTSKTQVGSTSLEVPAWGFWFAPLVTGGSVTAKKHMLPEVRTPLIAHKAHQQRLVVFLALLGGSLLALLYINADGYWMPFMGGAFARAHRQLKRLARSSTPKTAVEEKKALVYLHQAFNQHYGANIFARDVQAFVTLRPGFKSLQQEISQFFEASNQSLYDVKTRDSRQVIAQLVQLSKRLRDCERGVA